MRFPKVSPFHWSLICFVSGGVLIAAGFTTAAPLRQARVSEIIRDVKLLANHAAARPAAVSDSVTADTAVRTGTESRAELIFNDDTLARVGANTVFTFDGGTRSMDLGSGAVLLQVPKGAGGAKISTPAVTAAVTGTTIMFEYNAHAPAKLMSLEGVGKMCSVKHPDECVIVNAGEISIFTGGHFTKPVKFDVRKVMRSAKLIRGMKHKLPSLALINQVIREQGGSGFDENVTAPDGSVGTIDQRLNSQPPPPPPPPVRSPPGR